VAARPARLHAHRADGRHHRARPAGRPRGPAAVELLGAGLDQFRLDIGSYPNTSQGLDALQRNPGAQNWNGPYLKKAVPKDPWGNPYKYRAPGQHGEYDLWSEGADGAPGGEGENADIVSWDVGQ